MTEKTYNVRLLKTAARVFSGIMHPALVGIYGALILYELRLYNYFPAEYSRWISPELKRWVLIVVLINSVIVPISFLPFYRQRGIISSIRMENSRERIIPLTVQFFLFAISYYLFKRFYVPSLINLYIIGGAVAVLQAIIISRYWKISLHMLGMGALSGLVFIISLKYNIETLHYLPVILLASGVTGSSRLLLGEHNLWQVIAGFISGFMSTALLIAIL